MSDDDPPGLVETGHAGARAHLYRYRDAREAGISTALTGLADAPVASLCSHAESVSGFKPYDPDDDTMHEAGRRCLRCLLAARNQGYDTPAFEYGGAGAQNGNGNGPDADGEPAGDTDSPANEAPGDAHAGDD